MVICLENISTLKDFDAIELLLNLINAQIDEQLSCQSFIDIKLPETIEINNSKGQKMYKLNF